MKHIKSKIIVQYYQEKERLTHLKIATVRVCVRGEWTERVLEVRVGYAKNVSGLGFTGILTRPANNKMGL